MLCPDDDAYVASSSAQQGDRFAFAGATGRDWVGTVCSGCSRVTPLRSTLRIDSLCGLSVVQLSTIIPRKVKRGAAPSALVWWGAG